MTFFAKIRRLAKVPCIGKIAFIRLIFKGLLTSRIETAV